MRRRWEDDIKIGLKQIGWKGADCTDVQDEYQLLTLVKAGINLLFHKMQGISGLAPWSQFVMY